MVFHRESEANKALELRDADFKALFRFSQLMSNHQNLDELFVKMVEECRPLLEVDRVSLFVVDREKREVYTKASSNLEDLEVRMMFGRGIAGTVVFTGKLINLHNTEKDMPYTGFEDRTIVTSILAVPLKISTGEVLGVVQAINQITGQFDKRIETILITLCEMLSKALEHDMKQLEQKRLGEQLIYQAHHDSLTGLPNRALLEKSLEEWIENPSSTTKKLAILFIDLDHFKLINDSLGHLVGDGLLKQVAHRLQSKVRYKDLVARQGGDEFVVVLNGVINIQQVKKISGQILAAMRQPFFVNSHELYISASIGSSIYPDHGTSVPELMKKADHAMYQVKEKGKNDFCLFEMDMTQSEQRRLLLVTQLHKALEYGEFELYFQPQLNLRYDRFAGAEALIRWRHQELGMVSPGEFIPLAEETGLIIPIGNWVLEEACRQSYKWQQKGYPPVKVAVNVSALQFKRENFVEGVMEKLKLTGLDPQLLELEITEGMLLGDIEANVLKLKQLKELGVNLAIDDFGTGYSSLQYLKQLPVDTLKIDQFFVRDMDILSLGKNKSKALLDVIIMLGHNLDMKVLAEGVETWEQINYLHKAGCEEIQGYYHSKPLSAKDFEDFLACQNLPKTISV